MNGERRIGEMLPARKRIRLDEVEVLTSVKMDDTIEHLADVCESTSLALLNPACIIFFNNHLLWKTFYNSNNKNNSFSLVSKKDRLEIESIKSQAIQIYMSKFIMKKFTS